MFSMEDWPLLAIGVLALLCGAIFVKRPSTFMAGFGAFAFGAFFLASFVASNPHPNNVTPADPQIAMWMSGGCTTVGAMGPWPAFSGPVPDNYAWPTCSDVAQGKDFMRFDPRWKGNQH